MNLTASGAAESRDGVLIRRGRDTDAAACGEIAYQAFADVAAVHGFPGHFPDAVAAIRLVTALLGRARIYAVVAESDGRIVGSNFLHKHCAIAGVGPITVDPQHQNGGTGRRLMQAVLERAEETRAAGVRLVQATYHGRSLSLHTRLGFVVREPLALMQGSPIDETFDGYLVRALEPSDIASCDVLCRLVHGHDRHGELEDAVTLGAGNVIERDGRLTGYTTSIAYMGHAVAESNDDLAALIAASPSFRGLGFLLPMRNAGLFRWCLDRGLRVVQPMTLLSRGLYNEPASVYLPSVVF